MPCPSTPNRCRTPGGARPDERPALAAAPALIDGTGAKIVNGELLERVVRDDYHEWLSGAKAAGGCVRPIRLRGTIRNVDAGTGEVLTALDTEDTPDKAIYLPCGDRRASVCPPCAATYRSDTYQLIRAGLAGGKGMPTSVVTHPCVFATFTAPSFGPVHSRVVTNDGKVARCRPRRKADFCSHGRRISCGQRHREDEACLGQPLCPDCYDYDGAVVWNAHASELWRRTVIGIRRRVDKLAQTHGLRVRVSFAKVAEFQRRGLIHFHAIFRLDGLDPAHPERIVPPPLAVNANVLADAIRQAASVTRFVTVGHSMKPMGWGIAWGAQVDPRMIRLTGHGEITSATVARYLAKYATKSRHYSTTMRALRAARQDWRRRQNPLIRDHADKIGTLIIDTDMRWAGRGWRTSGDALLALSAAADAREQQRTGFEEARAA